MRVLVVHNRYRSAQPSGENVVVDEEAELLARAGCEVRRLTVDSDDIESFSVARRLALPARVVWSGDGRKRMAAALAEHRPDVVHVHNTFPLLSPAVLRIPGEQGIPVVLTLHNFRPICAAATLMRAGSPCELCIGGAQRYALRHGCYRGSRAATATVTTMNGVHRALGTWTRFVDCFVVPSEFAYAKFRDANWPCDRFVVKPNSMLPPRDRGVRERKGYTCVARLTHEKGVDVVVDAWRLGRPPERLTIVGDGDEAAALAAQAFELDDVRLVGKLNHDQTLDRIAGARALVVPSRCYEVAPRVVVEAFALGTPVIASKLGALEELVRDGENGLLVEPNSPPAFAAAATRLATDDRLAARLSDGAARTFRERLDPDLTTRRLIEIYRTAVARRRRSRDR